MTDGFLRPRWLERELAEIYESWRPLREAVARDWDRVLGTGPTPVAFRAARQMADRMAGPERPTFRVDDQPGYHTYSTRTERWIDRVPPAPVDALPERVSWEAIVAMYQQMTACTPPSTHDGYDRWAQGRTFPDCTPEDPR